MKFLKSALLLLSVATLVSACHPAHHPHHDGFCPPGQAKKGNC